MNAPSARLQVDHVDGRGAPAHAVHIWVEHGMLQLAGPGLLKQIPLHQVRWPDHTRHSAHLAHLPDGGSLRAHDSAAWDAWAQHHGVNDAVLARAQQSWRWSLMATLLLLAICLASYCWGVPLASHHASAQALAPARLNG